MASLASIGACGLLALGIAHASQRPAGTAADAARAAGLSVERRWSLILSPAPSDLALAQIRLEGSARERISSRALSVAVSRPFGDDYLAVATPSFGTPGGPRALVLLVNRPSALLDPVHVQLRLTARRTLGAPLTRKLSDPFTRPANAPRPPLCDLPLHGSALSAADLRPLHSRGGALTGFSAASAVAQAYDVVCGLPYASSFAQAVGQSPAPSSPTPPEAPSPAPPAPSPAPPVGRVPGEGCVPAPGYACPAAVSSTASVAAGEGERRTAAGAH
ncbi:MAG: hypothetical protein ACLQBY_11250 [Solirubrobacteraceae bacterium]